MAACELCGSEKVGTKQVRMGKAQVGACGRCIDKMGLEPLNQPTPVSQAAKKSVPAGKGRFTGGYSGGRGKAGRDLMFKGEKELRDDFARCITKAREKKGWDKRQLAHNMAEKINVIQSAENGKRPTDALIKKLERTLKIELMIESTHDEATQVGSGPSRGMNLGDFFQGQG